MDLIFNRGILICIIVINNGCKQRSTAENVNTQIPCQSPISDLYGQINLQEPRNPSVFRDLTVFEINRIKLFLYAQPNLNLIRSDKLTANSNYIYLIELFLPAKISVLRHLDNGMPQPVREARVVIVRGGQLKPDIIEILVGPLPNPNYFRPSPARSTYIRTYFLPASYIQGKAVMTKLKTYIDNVAGQMLLELYGGRMTNCGKRCIVIGFRTNVAPTVSGVQTRMSWYWMQQSVEYYVLHPIDVAVLVEIAGQHFKIHKVYFNGRLFKSLAESVNYYQANKFNFTSIPFPNGKDRQLFSTLKHRGEPHFSVPLRNPKQISPDGKRYNVHDRHVNYMFWDFEVSIGAVNGPQIFNIRYKNERIAYELSLQEIAALYSGASPHVQLDLFDSFFLLGTLSSYLIPGVDCPSDATFIDAYFQAELHENGVYNKHAVCIFEFNTGLPIRRHYSYNKKTGSFYEGMETTVLKVRSIITVSNYDYFIDFIFYPNGVIEVKAIATGYITGSFYHPGQHQYGYRLHNNLLGPLHQHLFHFKVDLDIKGTRNRFKTSHIELDVVDNMSKIKVDGSGQKAADKIYQNKIVHLYHSSEKLASQQATLGTSKYVFVVNENARDRYGNVAGYRIYNRQPTNLIRPYGSRREAGVSWARYMVAVTKQKETERRSSSMYANHDDGAHVVNFQSFLDDNEWIVDEDIVTWITIGLHHIPRTEDLPVTHTPGMDSSFILSPFNYFPEDPAISSTNTVRLDMEDKGPITIQRYGVKAGIDCKGSSDILDYLIKRDTCDIFFC